MYLKRIPFIIFSFLFFLGIFLVLNNLTRTKIPNATVSQKSQFLSPQASTETFQSLPKIIKIPKIGVEADIEQVGLDSQGRMDIPKDVDNTAWYNLGPKPGEKGSAVIDGHFDKVTGAPAVFYRVGELKNGDLIIVLDEKMKEFRFKVIDVKVYSFDSLPLKDIFARDDGRYLNLITCGGSWDQINRNYSNRTVVYAKLE